MDNNYTFKIDSSVQAMKTKKNKLSSQRKPTGYGFDFGINRSTFVVSPPDFLEHFNNSNIVACAYGVEKIYGSSHPIPNITIIGEKIEHLNSIFEEFFEWGAATDGDIVNVEIAIKKCEGYLISISKDIERTWHKLSVYNDIFDPLFLGTSWIKKYDTIHPMLLNIAAYCERPISPVIFRAGVLDHPGQNANIDNFKYLRFKIIKYNLKFIRESTHPEYYLFNLKEKNKYKPTAGDSALSCKNGRRHVIETIFPITKERIRRYGIVEMINSQKHYDNVCQDQVEQALINLIISTELTKGKLYYEGLGSKYEDLICKHISERFERATIGNDIQNFDVSSIKNQIDLDVRYILNKKGVQTTNKKFESLQALFLRKGYTGE